jgi:hypothetical protein
LQISLDARQESLRKSTKTDFRHLESIVYRSTGKTEEAVAAALQRLDRADATLVTSLVSLTNMKNHLVTTTKTVVDGFNEHAKTLDEISIRGDHGHLPFQYQSPSHGWPMPGPHRWTSHTRWHGPEYTSSASKGTRSNRTINTAPPPPKPIQ